MFLTRDKNLRDANRLFYHQVQTNLYKHNDHFRNCKIREKVARRPKHELLATAAKLCFLVRNNKVWSIPRTSGSSLNLTPQMRSFYLFHVYYTTRKILYEMGGIHSKGALCDDSVFNQKDNPYDVAAYKRIRAEFGVVPSTDFRYRKGSNHGLGKKFIYVTRAGPQGL